MVLLNLEWYNSECNNTIALIQMQENNITSETVNKEV